MKSEVAHCPEVEKYIKATHVPLARQIKCIEREIAMRVTVYARRVAETKMTQERADEEIAVMRAVLSSLQSIAQPELPIFHNPPK